MSRLYKKILRDADEHFAEVISSQRRHLACGVGCSFCCYGLFEIGAGDVDVIADGLRSLPSAIRSKIVAAAEAVVRDYSHPDIRNASEVERDAFFERTAAVACPALGDDGRCMMYESRPLVCRTFGLPIREGERYIGDICDLNFREATDAEKEEAAWDLMNEDPIARSEEYTIPEAILLAARLISSRKR
jgi:Fe-S-cluster containining protein